jgi:hypothetical protein
MSFILNLFDRFLGFHCALPLSLPPKIPGYMSFEFQITNISNCFHGLSIYPCIMYGCMHVLMHLIAIAFHLDFGFLNLSDYLKFINKASIVVHQLVCQHFTVLHPLLVLSIESRCTFGSEFQINLD